MTILEMKQRRAVLLKQANEVSAAAKAAGNELSDDDSTQIDALLDEADGLELSILNGEAAADRQARIDVGMSSLEAPASGTVPTPAIAGNTPLRITQEDLPWMTEEVGTITGYERTPEGRRDAYRAGMFFAATVYGNEAAMAFCGNNGIPIRKQNDAGQPVRTAIMNEGNNLSGGYLVPTEVSGRIVYLRDTFGLARRMCFIEPMASDKKTIGRQTGSITVYYPEEGGTITESEQTYGQVTLNARKAAALLRYSTELDEDAFVSLGDRVVNDMARGFAEAEDDAWINGDGTSTYGGQIGMRTRLVDGNHAAGAIDATSQDNTLPEIIAADLNVMLGTIPQYALDGGNLRWLGSQVTWARAIAPIIIASGGATMAETSDGPRRSYLGIPYESSPKMPNNATTDYENTAMLLLGDFRMGCTLGTRRGFRNTVLRERYAELDQVGIVATERYNVETHELGDGTTPGPIVGLIGN